MTSGGKTASRLKHSMRKWHPKILLAVVCLLCGTALPSPVEKVFYHRPAFNFLESNVSEATALTEWVSDIAAAGLQLSFTQASICARARG